MSQDSLIFNGKKYISSRRASEITGYTTDYVGQLARSEKISSRMVGRNRFIDENELLEYKANFNNNILPSTADFAESQNNHISHEHDLKTASPYLEVNQELSSRISDKRDQVVKPDLGKGHSLNTKISFVGSLLVVLLLGAFLNTKPGAQGFRSFSDNLMNKNQSLNETDFETANITGTGILQTLNKVDAVFLGYLDGIDNKIALYAVNVRDKFLNLFGDKPEVVYVNNTNQVPTPANSNVAQNVEFKVDDAKLKEYVREIMLSERSTFAPGGPYGGVVALPSSGDPKQDEILKQRIKDSFSDQVTVQFDSSGTSGVIRPVFKSGSGLSENYMFLLVPVNK